MKRIVFLVFGIILAVSVVQSGAQPPATKPAAKKTPSTKSAVTDSAAAKAPAAADPALTKPPATKPENAVAADGDDAFHRVVDPIRPREALLVREGSVWANTRHRLGRS